MDEKAPASAAASAASAGAGARDSAKEELDKAQLARPFDTFVTPTAANAFVTRDVIDVVISNPDAIPVHWDDKHKVVYTSRDAEPRVFTVQWCLMMSADKRTLIRGEKRVIFRLEMSTEQYDRTAGVHVCFYNDDPGNMIALEPSYLAPCSCETSVDFAEAIKAPFRIVVLTFHRVEPECSVPAGFRQSLWNAREKQRPAVIVVEGKRIKVDTAMMAASGCASLDRTFNDERFETARMAVPTTEWKNTTYDAAFEFLRGIYAGPDGWSTVKPDARHVSTWLGVMKLVHEHSATNLRHRATALLNACISATTYSTILTAAETHGWDDIVVALHDFARENVSAVVAAVASCDQTEFACDAPATAAAAAGGGAERAITVASQARPDATLDRKTISCTITGLSIPSWVLTKGWVKTRWAEIPNTEIECSLWLRDDGGTDINARFYLKSPPKKESDYLTKTFHQFSFNLPDLKVLAIPNHDRSGGRYRTARASEFQYDASGDKQLRFIGFHLSPLIAMPSAFSLHLVAIPREADSLTWIKTSARPAPAPPMGALARFAEMRDRAEGVDVRIMSSKTLGKNVVTWVHSLVMAACSDQFKFLLNTPRPTGTGVYDQTRELVLDATPNAIQLMVSYLYDGSIDAVFQNPLATEDLFDVMDLAVDYNLEDLYNAVELYIGHSMSKANIREFYDAAKARKMRRVCDKVEAYVRLHPEAIPYLRRPPVAAAAAAAAAAVGSQQPESGKRKRDDDADIGEPSAKRLHINAPAAAAASTVATPTKPAAAAAAAAATANSSSGSLSDDE